MFNIPKFTETIIENIEKAGYDAYLVGGCVRDIILGRTPNDWDIASSASPFDIIRIFKETVPIGLKYGTVMVFIGNEKSEVTTFRSEDNYSDCRRPSNVSFVSDIKADLSRRDFTINAMAYNSKKGLVDPFGGKEDLKRKVIKTVGKAEKRFDEDALRILRAYRFSSQLGFFIGSETLYACKNKAENVAKISGERIKTELDKILLSDNPQIIVAVLKSGALDFLFSANFKEFSAKPLKNLPKDIFIRTAALFYLAEFINREVTFARLHFSNREKTEVLFYLSLISKDLPNSKAEIKCLLKCKEDLELFKNALSLYSEIKGYNVSNLQKMIFEIETQNEPYMIKQLQISGKDLIELGVQKGPECGKVLQKLLDMVIEEPVLNDRKALISTIKSIRQVH